MITTPFENSCFEMARQYLASLFGENGRGELVSFRKESNVSETTKCLRLNSLKILCFLRAASENRNKTLPITNAKLEKQ